MNLNFRLKNHLLLAALTAAYPAFGLAAPAARVEFTAGNVMAVSSSGQRQLSRGSELSSGETINTGDGRAQLRFADGAMMSLQPQTEFRIDDYNYNGKNDGQEKGFFSLLRGGLRTISGYIGRGNRDAYKVTTSVATIGIRGTEWSGMLTPGATPDDTQLDVGTGEGAIEVCNAGGCLIVASGESAVIVGSSQPRRSEVRPTLPPSGVVNPPPPPQPYTPTENRNPDGTLPIIEDAQPVTQFTTGSNYAAITSGMANWDGVYPSIDQKSPTNVTFVDGKATEVQGSAYNYHGPVSVTDVQTLSENGKDAVIGWGRWTGGEAVGGPTYSLIDAHYVVGVPTPDAQIAQLSGSYNFDLTGATTPTWANGNASGTGTLNSATLGVSFNGPSGYTTNLSVDVTANGVNIALGGSGSNIYASSFFSGSGFGASSSLHYQGLLAGTNAKFAGVIYNLDDGGGTKVHGALGFTKGAAAP